MALLAGCVSYTGLTAEQRANLTPAAEVYDVRGEFNIAMVPVVNYVKQQPCSKTVVVGCRDGAVVLELQRLAHAADDQIKAAEAIVHPAAGTVVDPVTAQDAATAGRTALAALSAYLIEKGISQ